MIRRLNEQTDEGAGHGARAFVVSAIAKAVNDTPSAGHAFPALSTMQEFLL
jgi:hypothetical protein